MWVTARMLSAELGVSERTILTHCQKIEKSGIQVRTKVGKPARICREIFLRYHYGPAWRENDGE